MQPLPWSKQLIAAAVIAALAPSATIIAAKSFSDFLVSPHAVRFAQEMGPPPAGTPPMMPPPPLNMAPQFGGGGQGMPLPSGTESQHPNCPMIPDNACPQGMMRQMENPPGGCPIVKCTPAAGVNGNQGVPGQNGIMAPLQGFMGNPSDRTQQNNTAQPGMQNQPSDMNRGDQTHPTSSFEDCARGVLGGDLDAFRRGERQPSEDQKRAVREKCESMKSNRGSPPPVGQFPGSQGQFPSQGPNDFRGRVPEQTQGNGPMPQQQNMGPQGQQGQFGSQGPSEADTQRQEQEQKQREEEQQKRMLQEVKRNIKQMEQGYSMMTKGLRVCDAAKIEIPAEVRTGLTNMQSAIAKVKSATSADDIQDIDFSDFGSIGDQVRELVDTCHQLQQLPRITKQFGRMISQTESEFNRLVSQSKRSKFDVSDQLAKIGDAIAQAKATLAAVNGVTHTADALEEAMSKVMDLQNSFQDVHEEMGAVRAILNMQRGLSDANRQIRDAERRIGTLKRRHVNTAEIEGILAEGKAAVAEINALAKSQPIDVDVLVDAFAKLEDIGSRAEDTFAKLEGKNVQRGPDFGRSPGQDLKLDVFNQFRKPESNSGNESSGSSSGDVEALFGL